MPFGAKLNGYSYKDSCGAEMLGGSLQNVGGGI